MSSEVRNRATTTANPEPNKPDNSAFKQQRLPAWQPVLTAKSVLPEWIHFYETFSLNAVLLKICAH